LRVGLRRPDGYHELESLVAFAKVRDRLTLETGGPLSLTVQGPRAQAAGPPADNLVLKAARALKSEIKSLKLGRFGLTKRLPVAAGLGGGSADAAAALRLLARANTLRKDDERLLAAARATGADVPVCLDPRARIMRGIGDVVSPPLRLPALHAVLANPGVPVPTKDVFAALGALSERRSLPPASDIPEDEEGLLAYLETRSNDLEAAAITLQPVIARVLLALRDMPGCRLARMSGSGATCFGLFERAPPAAAAARVLATRHPLWWVEASVLG
jgi:4-diphosphocytidyl-2-C-methyl-D-erythritol kinase